MEEIYQKYPSDWYKARQIMADIYYHNEPEETKSIFNANLNGACAVLAMLYGQGNVSETLKYSCIMGFDADNQAATLMGLYALAKGLDDFPRNLVYPVEGATKPFNDQYINISTEWGSKTEPLHLPDIGISEMTNGMAAIGEDVILKNGGQKITCDGAMVYKINRNASFKPPFELPSYQVPALMTGKQYAHQLKVTIPNKHIEWSLQGPLPDGITFENGLISGMAKETGLFSIYVEAKNKDNSASQHYTLIVYDENLANNASKIISNVVTMDSFLIAHYGKQMSDYYLAKNIEVINDGIVNGKGATFLSISKDKNKSLDYYGYEWEHEQLIGSVLFYTGGLEHTGGWFNSLAVEYLNKEGKWVKAESVVISPLISGRNTQLDKAHFFRYFISISPVATKGVRIIGEAGGGGKCKTADCFYSPYTSIAELVVSGVLHYK
jgi:hypothetical protein